MILTAWSSVKLIQFNRQRNAKLQSIQQEKQLLLEEAEKTKTQNENLEKSLRQKEEEIKKLKQAKARIVPTTYAKPVGDAKAFIYARESGNRPNAVNSLGCIGLGQACPSGAKPRLLRECPNWQTNYACQDAFFTRYMQSRYGTWENARIFWLRNHWW